MSMYDQAYTHTFNYLKRKHKKGNQVGQTKNDLIALAGSAQWLESRPVD